MKAYIALTVMFLSGALIGFEPSSKASLISFCIYTLSVFMFGVYCERDE